MAREPTDPRLERNSSAPSGASDISVYGLPPIAPGLSGAMLLGGTPMVAEAAVVPPGPANGQPAPSVSNVASNVGDTPLTAALLVPVMLADAAMAGLAALAADPPVIPEAATNDIAEPADRVVGSGTPPGLLTQDAVVPIPAAMPPQENAAAASPPAVTDSPSATQPLQAPAEAVLDRMGERIDAIEDTVTDIGAGLGDRVTDIGSTVDAVGAGLADRVADISETVDTIGAGLTDRLEDLSGTVTAGLGDRLDDVNATVGAAAGGLADTLAALPEIDLGLVGGTDPEGGIDTLVGMVSAADIFGLPDIGGGDAALALPPGIAGGDLLAEFAPSDVLLNVPDPHDGAFGLLAGLIDDHHG